jgi:hypothetical protein
MVAGHVPTSALVADVSASAQKSAIRVMIGRPLDSTLYPFSQEQPPVLTLLAIVSPVV